MSSQDMQDDVAGGIVRDWLHEPGAESVTPSTTSAIGTGRPMVSPASVPAKRKSKKERDAAAIASTPSISTFFPTMPPYRQLHRLALDTPLPHPVRTRPLLGRTLDMTSATPNGAALRLRINRPIAVAHRIPNVRRPVEAQQFTAGSRLKCPKPLRVTKLWLEDRGHHLA
ncbi:hypothetical protein B0H10DRAFT_1945032 [Mycena sp. CBHHK59/15]|nr:hypothetical protein B0H10DRAFT_1945032 [Mycena sp. CBHHK59/15]